VVVGEKEEKNGTVNLRDREKHDPLVFQIIPKNKKYIKAFELSTF
jgi:hypothetical protein